jgi:hypothetical protein
MIRWFLVKVTFLNGEGELDTYEKIIYTRLGPGEKINAETILKRFKYQFFQSIDFESVEIRPMEQAIQIQ